MGGTNDEENTMGQTGTGEVPNTALATPSVGVTTSDARSKRKASDVTNKF